MWFNPSWPLAALSPFIIHLIIFALVIIFLSLEYIKFIAISEPVPCILLEMLFQILTQIPIDFPCLPRKGICSSLLYPQSLYVILFHFIILVTFTSFELICYLDVFFIPSKLFERLLYACLIHRWSLTKMAFNKIGAQKIFYTPKHYNT